MQSQEQRIINLIESLSKNPAALGEQHLEWKETHISRVLVGQNRVFKFKKPVQLDFVDQRSLEQRARLCLLEWKLNSRLSPDVYLDIWFFQDNSQAWDAATEVSAAGTDKLSDIAGSDNSGSDNAASDNGSSTEEKACRSETKRSGIASIISHPWPNLESAHSMEPEEAVERALRSLRSGQHPSSSNQEADSQDALPQPEKALPKDAPIDVCVVMKHLPDSHRLEDRIQEATSEDMERLAEKISSFHRRQERQAPSEGFAHRLGNLLHTLQEFREVDFLDSLQQFVENKSPWLARRRQKEIDGHGDLRLDHIYLLGSEVQIIDCVEFSPEIRQVDPYEDLAFTTMGLRLDQREDLARDLALSYLHRMSDVRGYLLMDLYEIYRACVRLMVDSLQLDGAEDSSRKTHLQKRISEYEDLIQDLLTGRRTLHSPPKYWKGPLIIMLSGLPATGKSRIAALLRKDGIPVISSDVLRKSATENPENRNPQAFGQGIYSPKQKERIYRRMAAMCKLLMEKESVVCLDASFSRREYRRIIYATARSMNPAPAVLILQTDCEEGIIEQRLEKRKHKPGFSDLTDFQTWKQLKKAFHPIEGETASDIDVQFTVLDTSGEKRDSSLVDELRIQFPGLFRED